MKRRSRLALVASATAVAASGLTMTAPSALAHGENLLPTICGSSSYFIVDDEGGIRDKAKRPVTTPGGSRWGYVYLLYSNSTKKNCVVTRKTTFHGTPSRTVAVLIVRGRGQYEDPPRGSGAEFSHYADVQASAAGRCVQYFGHIWNPRGTTLATGGRGAWGNCD